MGGSAWSVGCRRYSCISYCITLDIFFGDFSSFLYNDLSATLWLYNLLKMSNNCRLHLTSET